ncbi:MAG TPA: hypothetical protein VJ596_12440 [Gemmatimonadaceae bacterium]|nr:hypothetical protein [Gemmatimonadaceae bacterium]
MPFLANIFRRSSALTLAAILAACSDYNAPVDTLTPEEVEVVASAVNSEVELSLSSLLPENASNILNLRRAARRGGLMLGRPAGGAFFAEELACGTPSQDPAVDSDDDTVPDDLTMTFALPACHFESEGSAIDFTGTVRVVDPTPAVGGLAFDVTLGDLTFAFESHGGAGSLSRDGTQQVRVAGSGLSQTHDFTLVSEFTGEPAATVENEWSASFVPAQGQSVTFGLPLPDGTYTIDGELHWTQGDRYAVFAIDTYTALEYDATCHQQGAASPFQSGEVHVVLDDNDGAAYVRIRYESCGVPEVVFVGGNA